MHIRIRETIDEFNKNPHWLAGEETLIVLAKIGEVEDCDCILNAIEKRLEIAETRNKEHHAKYHTEGDDIRFLTETCLELELARLGDAVIDGLQQPSFAQDAPSAQRKELAARIMKSSEYLIACIGELFSADYGYPTEVEHALADYRRTLLSESLHELEHPSHNSAPHVIDENVRSVAEFVAITFCDVPVPMLKALQHGVQQWSAGKPIIARPEGKNADRLRLIRHMTAHFRQSYGTPLRACTLAVASAFFDCDGLSESDIAKLAP